MSSPSAGLRERQADLTRRLLFEALGQLLVEGKADVSVQEVADRAGVSHRTVYRHFPSRDALIDGFVKWIEAQIADRGGMSVPARADQLAESVRQDYAVMEEFADVVAAAMRLGLDRDKADAHRLRRNEAILGAVSEVTLGLDGPTGESVAWVVRLLTSSETWMFLREEGGLDDARAAAAVAWAIDTLLDALRSGDGPGAPGKGGAEPEE